MKNSIGYTNGNQFGQQSRYATEPFSVSPDGHYIGQDGFIVPKNFPEFYERNSRYVRRWASKWLHKYEKDEVVCDWEQDLLLYLYYLPETSKARKPTDRHPEGCIDVIQCFDPHRQYGASERRFLNFVNICLHNRSLSIVDRMSKNPVCRKDNVSIGASSDSDNLTVNDEYVHSHSQIVRLKSAEQSSNIERRFMAKRFMEFVLAKEPNLYDTVLAIAEAGTLRDAQETLQVDGRTFTRDRRRIIQLKNGFLDGGPIAKQRKPYRERKKAPSSILGVLST